MFTNIAAYKFAHLTDLKGLRERLLAQCKGWGLKGTILISTEGINLFVAGPAAEIEQLVEALRTLPGLGDLAPKYSDSVDQPFTRMLVRIKKEIIAFGVDGIDPATRTSPKLSARELKQWLDEGRPVTLLDTRNDYEVKLGTFHNAIPAGIDTFRQFPDAVARLPETLKDQPIVMFCTGGIRCEKAGPFMEREGFQKIFQLDGGILKYFEECGSDHYDGECFVFDQRVGVDPALRETSSSQCFHCQTPLTAEDQADERYVPGRSCPYCHRDEAEEMAHRIARRHAALRAAATPLPGSEPYENRRPLSVPGQADGLTVLDFLGGTFPQTPREEWAALCAAERFVDGRGAPVSADRIVRAGERFYQRMPLVSEPDVNPGIQVLHEDEAILVLNKPAPLPMHPCGRFNRNTLQYLLEVACHPEKPRPAHRLDANTTGVVVCSRTRHYARGLQPQFERGEVGKVYLARVHGHPAGDEFTCDLPISTGPGELGSRTVDAVGGLPARTDFRVLRRHDDGTSLLEVRPLTGRTNQIRVHLWKMGTPIVGDPAYLPGGQLGDAMTLPLGAPPMCLHAWKVSFLHPVDGVRREFEAPAPPWAVG